MTIPQTDRDVGATKVLKTGTLEGGLKGAVEKGQEACAQVADRLLASSSVVLTTHVNPDADGVGSALALKVALERLGKRVWVALHDGLPQKLAFLPGADQIIRADAITEGCDVLCAVDCGSLERLGGSVVGGISRNILINIDHHVSNVHFGEINWVDGEASATGEMIVDLVERLGVEGGQEMAVPLFAALINDTGSFKYANTTAKTFLTAAKLCEWGGRPWPIHLAMSENVALAEIRLQGLALAAIQFAEEGQVATLVVTRAMLAEALAEAEHTEALVHYARSIAGVEVAVMMREEEENVWKLSLRSKHRVDVSVLASNLGGGGHRRAAGVTLYGSRDDVMHTVLGAVGQAL